MLTERSVHLPPLQNVSPFLKHAFLQIIFIKQQELKRNVQFYNLRNYLGALITVVWRRCRGHFHANAPHPRPVAGQGPHRGLGERVLRYLWGLALPGRLPEAGEAGLEVPGEQALHRAPRAPLLLHHFLARGGWGSKSAWPTVSQERKLFWKPSGDMFVKQEKTYIALIIALREAAGGAATSPGGRPCSRGSQGLGAPHGKSISKPQSRPVPGGAKEK